MEDKRREANYDLLRIISAAAVVAIHVSSMWLGAVTEAEPFAHFEGNELLGISFYNALARFAVPCFVMLSGAFLLADERNARYRYFYRKTFKTVGVQTVIFSALAVLAKLLAAAASGGGASELLAPIVELAVGQPYYHMWYLYMMIGVYLLVPVLFLFKNSVSEKTFSRATWIFLAAASVSYETSSNLLQWDIGASFRYVSYFMAGYEIRRALRGRKNNGKGALLIGLGVLAELAVGYLRYLQALAKIADEALEYRLVEPLCPLVVVASLLIFAGFSMLDVKKDFGKLAALTFFIYLFHAVIWHFLSYGVRRFCASCDSRIVIPLCVLAVFLLSVPVSVVYRAVFRRADSRFGISEKICALIGLGEKEKRT